MPRIRNLKLWLSRRLRKDLDSARFKIISREYYEKRWWGMATEVEVMMRIEDGKPEYVVDVGGEDGKEYRFESLDDVVKFIESRCNPEYCVYYYTSIRDLEKSYETFDNLRHVLDLTWGEYHALSLLIARAMGHLNDRRLRGFQRLTNTSKKCRLCRKRPAKVRAVFEYGYKVYSVYYCEECWREVVNRAMDNMIRDIESYREKLIRYVEGGRGVS